MRLILYRLPISNGGTGANNLSSLAQALAGTGQLGGVPRLVGVFATSPPNISTRVTITGLTPGHLLLWHTIANQNDLNRGPLVVDVFAPAYSVDSGLLVARGMKQKHGPNQNRMYRISRVGVSSFDDFSGQNMDMAIIVGSTINVDLAAFYDDYAEVRFYQL